MKYIFFSFLLLLAFPITYSQNSVLEKVTNNRNHRSFKDNKYFPKANSAYLLDSIYDYDGSNLPDSEWSSFHKEIIASRTDNGLPLQSFYIYEWYESGLADTLGSQIFEYPDIYDSCHYTVTRSSKDIYSHEWKYTSRIKYTIEDESEAEIEQSYEIDNWINDSKNLYQENNTGNLYTCLVWNRDDNIWEQKNRTINFFNNDSSEYTHTSESFSDNEWHISTMKKTWFNSNGYDTLQVELRSYEGELTNDIKTRNNYNDNNYLTSSMDYVWNRQENKWYNSSKLEYELDSNNNYSSKLRLVPDTLNSWKPYYKEESTYNIQNQKTSMIRSFYQEETGGWLYQMKYTNEYLGDLLIFSRIFFWIDSTWQASDYTGYEYDELDRKSFVYCSNPNYPRDRTFYEYFDENEHQSYIRYRQTYYQIDSIWINSEKNIEYRNKHIAVVDEIPINTFKFYPNPSSDYIIIESDVYHSHHTSFEIFDIQGRIIKSGKLSLDGRIKTEELINGPYLIKIYNTEGKTLSLCFIKE